MADTHDIVLPIYVGPDPGDKEPVGELRLNSGQLRYATAMYLEARRPYPVPADKADQIARALVEALKTRDRPELVQALQEWLTGEVVWNPVFDFLGERDGVPLVVQALCDGHGDAELRRCLGSGPLARRLCGHFGFRYMASADKRRKLSADLFNLPQNGRPSALPPQARIRERADYFTQLLQPLAKAVRDGADDPWNVYTASAAHVSQREMVRFVDASGMREKWQRRNWVADGRRRGKITAFSLACELLAHSLDASPAHIERIAAGVLPRNGRKASRGKTPRPLPRKKF